MDGNNLDKVGIKIIFFLLIIFLIILIRSNYKDKELKNNELYTFGKVLKVYYGNGNRTVKFQYKINNKIFILTSSEFTKEIKQVNSMYFVIVNKNDLEHAYILDCCPYDQSKHFVPSEGLNKIPDAELQKKVDEAFEEIFNSPLGRLLPPY